MNNIIRMFAMSHRNTDSIFQNYITHVYYKMDRQLMGEVSVENRNGH